MYQATMVQTLQQMNPAGAAVTLPVSVETQTDDVLGQLLDTLSTSPYWPERQAAAIRLGDLGGDEAHAGLVAALPDDPFWMVRCTIVQSLERIGKADSMPVLQATAERDPNQVVRQYAAATVQYLSFTS
jgi:HEAT repeat protein